MKNIRCGVADLGMMPAMRSEVKAAVLNGIISEAQRQPDEFLAKKAE